MYASMGVLGTFIDTSNFNLETIFSVLFGHLPQF